MGPIRMYRAGLLTMSGILAVSLTACGGEETASFDTLETAVIQLEATGTFEVPGKNPPQDASHGSGFLLDSSGLAVTTNHVVTGAGTLNVGLGEQEHSAQVLGVSECFDLAVVDLEGENFPYLEWRDGDISNALEVWAAGFPIGDPQFNITQGIISKKDTPVASKWAAMDHAIEHDARIRAGNSGGPLVDAEGRAVGVNYPIDDQLDLSVAIHRDEALRVIGELQKGQDVLSLGLNSKGYAAKDGSISGIFVSAVEPGSSAAKAGVEAGDIVTHLQGIPLSTDGTMDEYCSILRTHGQDATLDIKVFRPGEGINYIGQVNGDPLAPSQQW
jgi:serine protease Do